VSAYILGDSPNLVVSPRNPSDFFFSLKDFWHKMPPYADLTLRDEESQTMRTTLNVLASCFFCITLILPAVHAAPGDLDLTFSQDGKLYDFLLRGNNDEIHDTAIQADGKTVAVGVYSFGAIPSCAVSRYNVDGTLDLSFDGDGMSVFPSGRECIFNSVVIQTDGKIVAVGTISEYGLANSDFIVIRYNGNGTLDTSFDMDGVVITPIGSGDDEAYGVAIQPDTKIVVAGSSWSSSESFAVVRYNPDGSLDTSFDSDGKSTASFFGNSGASAVAIQPDGKLITAGSAPDPFIEHFAFVRFNANGSLDNSFDTDGKLIVDVTGIGYTNRARAVSVQPDGKIVAGGYCTVVTGGGSPPPQNHEFAAVRLNTDGSPDVLFDGDGIAIHHMTPFDDIAEDMAIQADGKIIIAGRAGAELASPEGFGLLRINTNGSLDSSFNGSGRVISLFETHSAAKAVSVQPDGRIVTVGRATFCCGSSDDFTVLRYNANGTPDNTVSTDGRINHDVGFRWSFAKAVAMQPNGKFVVAGVTTDDFAVIRYNADGTHDTSFDGDGKVVTAVTPDGDELRALAIQADGKVVVTGYAGYPVNPPQSNDTVVVRYKNDGSLDETFDSDGKLFLNLGDSESATAVAIQPDGKIVTAGYVWIGGAVDVVLTRLNTDGSFDNSFDMDGRASVTGLEFDTPTALALQPDGKIVVVGSAYNGTNYDFLVVRMNSDGSLDTTFDFDGVALTPIGSSQDAANALTIQPDGRIVAAGRSSNGANDDFALVRYNPSGSLDLTFDFDGKQTTPLLTIDVANAVAVQQNGKIILAGASSVNTNLVRADFAMVRYNTDGTLDNSFNQDGKLTLDLWGASRDEIQGMVLDANGRALVAGQGASNFAVARIHGDFVPDGRTPFDFDGDGKADVSVYRPSTGVWYQLFSSGIPYGSPTFGLAGDIPVPADFDGDDKTDLAIFRPSTGDWWYRASSDGTLRAAHWGAAGDIPLPVDINNDGQDDFVVFRPSSNYWYRATTTGIADEKEFGLAGDKPLIGDFDGDGKADQAIFRPSTGDWWYSASSAGGAFRATHWGQNGDVPAPADFDGDGKTDLAVFRASNGGWYILNSGDLSFTIISFGLNGDRPVPADYDGDGRADIAVFRPSTGVWYVIQSTSGTVGYQWGLSTDVAIPNAFVQP
jgi:uncharacterized delta-60 repeat protein